MNARIVTLIALPLIAAAVGLGVAFSGGQREDGEEGRGFDGIIAHSARQMLREGRQTFRFDTFGGEDFWGGTLGLHRAMAAARLGGVGPGVSPRTALAVGRKVDRDALPAELVRDLKGGRVDLDDPATTLALLQLHAVVGVTGFFD